MSGEERTTAILRFAERTVWVARLNANKEQIPLGWKVLPRQPPDTGASTLEDSLSLKAAIAAHGNESSLRSLQSSARQPYARTVPKIPEESSTALLCSSNGQGAKKPCSANEHTFPLGDKVVVIGAENEVDHPFLLGERIYGFRLQALYIDALLSDNYLYAAPGYLAVSLFWGFLVVLEAVLVSMEVYSHRRWHVSASLKARVQWIWIFSSVFFVATIIVFSLKHYLPPS